MGYIIWNSVNYHMHLSQPHNILKWRSRINEEPIKPTTTLIQYQLIKERQQQLQQSLCRSKRRQMSHWILKKRMHVCYWHSSHRHWKQILQRSRLPKNSQQDGKNEKRQIPQSLSWQMLSLFSFGLFCWRTCWKKKELQIEGLHLWASKFHREYSEITFFVCTRMNLALVRANTTLLWRSRERRHINLANFVQLVDGTAVNAMNFMREW